MTKVKVAMDWLAACAGCEMSVLDMDERLVQLLEKIELTSTPITDLKHPPKEGVTVGILSGASTIQPTWTSSRKCGRGARS